MIYDSQPLIVVLDTTVLFPYPPVATATITESPDGVRNGVM